MLTNIPKFQTIFSKPPVYSPDVITDSSGNTTHEYEVSIEQFQQQILPAGYPSTTVFGYRGLVDDGSGNKTMVSSAPGPTFEAIRGIPVNVKWINNLDLNMLHSLPVDGTLHWANPNGVNHPPSDYPIPFDPQTRLGIPDVQRPVPTVIHLHGAENPAEFDGHPEAWFTKNKQQTGPTYVTDNYIYPNQQPPATLWYHDHTLGMTRLNVYAGLAGFYLLNEEDHPLNNVLPTGDYDVPIVIQDRSFTDDGQLLMDLEGVNPEVHPYWTPENFGNTIMVNGKVWPNFDVEKRQYRFRLLNGSNARFYNIRFELTDGSLLPFKQIATDGGFLPQAVDLTNLLIAPGQRAEILVDFSGQSTDTKIIMKNDAAVPFSNDGTTLPDTDPTTDIMQFTVLDTPITPANLLPVQLNEIPNLVPNRDQRLLTLNEVLSATGEPLMLLLDGQKWNAPVSEKPLVGSTEDWVLINLTADTHPIHLHLVQFQIISRQDIDSPAYLADWLTLNGGQVPLNQPTRSLPVENYVNANPIIPPEANEQGWHDTVQAHPGQITRIRVRFAPIDLAENEVSPGENKYPFEPAGFPGYVWHCHILDHEDNEMMRPYEVINPGQSLEANPQTCCQHMIEFKTQLVSPALADSVKTHVYFAQTPVVEMVCPEKVIICGKLTKKITYTAVKVDGSQVPKTLYDEQSFQCMIDREDANEGDQYDVVGADILCEGPPILQNRGTRPNQSGSGTVNVFWRLREKDIIKVCIRKRGNGSGSV